MQRPSIGYRGGIRVGHHYTHTHHIENDVDDDNISLSNSDDNLQTKPYSSLEINNDFESAIRNLRPSATRQKKSKSNLNISKQKADLPQLNTTNDENQNNSLNEQKQEENILQDKQSRRWFPKADVGHVDSDDFIRHNHVGKFIQFESKK
jgi:hypothetical protein